MDETKELPKIEENVKENTDNDKRRVFVAQIGFWQPDSGPVQLLARDEAHARELLPKMLSHFRDLVIYDLVDQSNIVKPQAIETPDVSPPAGTQVH